MEKPDQDLIPVEVAFALPQRQRIVSLRVAPGTTALEAARRSGLAQEFPGLDVEQADMGIFSKNLDGKLLPLPADYVLKPRDRVEIYRPLEADPKAARQQRAAKAKANAKGDVATKPEGAATEAGAGEGSAAAE
jgi:putative ubiquitin-RnfH superfamily antitoxin RatB of RatAB toxin-antitoxin module